MLRSSNSTRHAMTARAPANVLGAVRGVRIGVVCRSIHIIAFDVGAHASDAPMCCDSVRYVTEGASAAYFIYPLIPSLIDATAYVAKAAREAGLHSIVNMSQTGACRESKAITLAMTGFPSEYSRFAMSCGCLNVSMPLGCHLFVSCPAAGRVALAQYPQLKNQQLRRVAQALSDALTTGLRVLLPMPVRALGRDAERDARRLFE
jgi:hypothetical protein